MSDHAHESGKMWGMRIIRLAALVGSLVLLAASSVSLINRRSQLFDELDVRVSSAVTVATNSINSALIRARAVADLANESSTLDEVLASFEDTSSACVGPTGNLNCSGSDLSTFSQYGAAAGISAANGGRAAAVVDVSSDSVLVVARGDITVIMQLPLSALVGPFGRASIAEYGTEFTMRAVSDGNGQTTVLSTVDGTRVLQSIVSGPLDDGAIVVVASIPNDVGLGADSPSLYAILLLLGTILLGLAAFTFIVDRRQLEERASTDELTGLVNRREFEEQSAMAIEMSARLGTGLCVMLIDLNGFKQINDSLGHHVGDRVLRACADRLTGAVRDTDLVGRWGGDEFVILLPGIGDASAVRNSAERIGESLSSTPIDGDIYISGSIGAALYQRHGKELAELIKAADAAMYEAKSTGVLHRLAEAVTDHVDVDDHGYHGPDRRQSPAQINGG